MDKTRDRLPGLLLAIIIASISSYLGGHLPLVGGPVFALILGIVANLFIGSNRVFEAGLDFTSKSLLKLAIILLGFGLSIGQILEVGKISLTVMVFTLAASFGFGALFGRLFKMDWKLSTLISAGTGICGGSAIAALSPVIEARDSDVTYAISATFIFDILMIVLFPIMGAKLGLSDLAYGLWTGTAVNDTSSVVAAGYAFSDRAGEFATIVKLTRTLSIIPTVVLFSYINQRKKVRELGLKGMGMSGSGAGCRPGPGSGTGSELIPGGQLGSRSGDEIPDVEGSGKGNANQAAAGQVSLRALFPFFIAFFILAAIVNSMGLVPGKLGVGLNSLSKFLMIMALGAIGLKTDLREVKNSGPAPMLHGFIISAIVVIVSLGVQVVLGQV